MNCRIFSKLSNSMFMYVSSLKAAHELEDFTAYIVTLGFDYRGE